MKTPANEEMVAEKYERVFVVAVPVARVWQAFVDPREREAWISPPGRDRMEHPEMGFPHDASPPPDVTIGAVEENRRLSWSEVSPLPSGGRSYEEITFTFEEVGSGTRITLTRSHFGDGEDWQVMEQATRAGLDQALIDLIAYLETGVNVSRHYAIRSSIGASLISTDTGLRVTFVAPGGFAEEAGLRAGDLLISIGGAGVYTRSDVSFLQREHDAGEELEVTYIRDRALRRGRGRLSAPFITETFGGIGT